MNAHPTPTVFIVDDYPPVRRSISRLLRAAGFAVAAFASAKEFLVQYDPQTLGCLVLDVAMPTLNGLELQRILEKAGSDLPIIFLTGQGDIPMTVTAMKAGAVDFLTKPFAARDLLDAVQRAVEKDTRNLGTEARSRSLHARVKTLTPRERQVFALVVTGMLNKQIAGSSGSARRPSRSTALVSWRRCERARWPRSSGWPTASA